MTTLTPNAPGTGHGSHFQDEARAALVSVRQAVGGFVEALPQPVRRAADLQRTLGVDKVLAWQVFRVWSAADPLHAARHIPSPGLLSRVLKAGADRGVPPGVIEGVAAACQGFESLVERHAGDRGSFDSMIAGLGAGAIATTLRDRRAAFRANGRLWGLRAQTQIGCGIYHPSAGGCDSLLITGYVGVQPLRPGARVRVSARSRARDDAAIEAARTHSTADPAHPSGTPDLGAVELVEEFCSRPLPSFVTRETTGNMLETSLDFNGVGRSSAVTYFLRRLVPGWPPPGDTWFGVGGTARVPSEALLVDMLVPAGWTDPRTAWANVFGNLFETERALDYHDEDRLTNEVNEHLGDSRDRLRTLDCPRYQEMVEHVLERMGWHRTRFDIYRCRVRYPILHACVSAGVTAVPPEHRGR